MKNFSIIIPAYNESVEIIKTLTSVHAFCEQQLDDYEIIVVNDGSTDDTGQLIAAFSEQHKKTIPIRFSKNEGKGAAVRAGVLRSAKDYVIFTDADLSTPPGEMINALRYLKNGYDIVIGSRALKESRVQKRQGIVRQTMGKVFNFFVATLLFRGIHDTQCGFKCFTRAAAKNIFSALKITGFCFDVEVLYKARKKKFRIKEMPVVWINREESRVALVRSPLSMFYDLFRIKMNGIRGLYS